MVVTRSDAGIADPLIGGNQPLKKRIDVGRKGTAVDDALRVEKCCAYQFELRLLHKKKMMDEHGLWDRYRADKKEPPVQVHLTVLGLNRNGRHRVVFDADVLTHTTGGNRDMTIRHIASVLLDRGNYHVRLEFLHDVPELNGAQADFVIQQQPKTVCPKKASVEEVE